MAVPQRPFAPARLIATPIYMCLGKDHWQAIGLCLVSRVLQRRVDGFWDIFAARAASNADAIGRAQQMLEPICRPCQMGCGIFCMKCARP